MRDEAFFLTDGHQFGATVAPYDAVHANQTILFSWSTPDAPEEPGTEPEVVEPAE